MNSRTARQHAVCAAGDSSRKAARTSTVTRRSHQTPMRRHRRRHHSNPSSTRRRRGRHIKRSSTSRRRGRHIRGSSTRHRHLRSHTRVSSIKHRHIRCQIRGSSKICTRRTPHSPQHNNKVQGRLRFAGVAGQRSIQAACFAGAAGQPQGHSLQISSTGISPGTSTHRHTLRLAGLPGNLT
jgi:hypothetical protein